MGAKPWIIQTPQGEFRLAVRRAGPRSASWLESEPAQHVWFFAQYQLQSQDPRALVAAINLFIELGGDWSQSPTRNMDPDGAQRLARELERAVQSGRIVVEKIPRLAVSLRQGEPASASAQAREAFEPSTSTTKKETTWFEVQLVDEVGEPVADVPLVFTHEGRRTEKTTDGGGKARLDASGISFASIELPDAETLRATLQARWDSPRQGEWLVDGEDVTSCPLWGERLESLTLMARRPHTLSLQPPAQVIRLLGFHFDTDKCFLLPAAIANVRRIRQLHDQVSTSTLLIAGHTEPSGQSVPASELSLERARALAAYLWNDVDAWLEWYGAGKPAEQRWGAGEDKLMLQSLPDYPTKPRKEDPVRWFQRTRGLQVDGIAGPKTRRQLITEYMGHEGTTLPEGIEWMAHGCGDGFALAEAPSSERMELFFFHQGLGIQPMPPGEASESGSPEYPEWARRARKVHVLDAAEALPGYSFLELHDALFRSDSSVVLPEGENPTAQQAGHLSLTTVGIFASVLRYTEEHPNKKLVVAGHTDTTASVDHNQRLSEERARCALAVLLGERDTFVSLCHKRHKVADYKQILSWISRAFEDLSFDCDPGAIDDNAATGVGPVRRFQRDYNQNKAALGAAGPDLAEDGAIGPLTWGALFDCYEYALRQELGEEAAGVEALRQQLVWVDPARKSLGFNEQFPIDKLGRDNYRSQANRRVEILLFDEGEEPDLDLGDGAPEMSDIYLPGHYRREPLEPLLSALPWRAHWERAGEPARMDEPRNMLLDAPGLPVGESVTYTLKEYVNGAEPVTVLNVVVPSQGDASEAPFVEWFADERRPHEPGQQLEVFPRVAFQFEAASGGRLKKSPMLEYADLLDVTLQHVGDGGLLGLLQGEVLTPWGVLKVAADEQGRVLVEALPPGGCRLVFPERRLLHG